MAPGPHVFCAGSEVAVKNQADGQPAKVRAARACPPELGQRIGVLPDADLDVDGFLRLSVAEMGRKGPVHLGGGIQALKINDIRGDKLHQYWHP